jgi:hypothetical protein
MRLHRITWRVRDLSRWMLAAQTVHHAGGDITVEGEGVWRVTWGAA